MTDIVHYNNQKSGGWAGQEIVCMPMAFRDFAMNMPMGSYWTENTSLVTCKDCLILMNNISIEKSIKSEIEKVIPYSSSEGTWDIL